MRDDPNLLSLVQSINSAYEVLGDPSRRAVYDAQVASRSANIPSSLDPDIETCILLVRCANTKETFRMLLGRKFGSKNLFRVLGFEPVNQAPKKPQVASLPQSKSFPALPEPVSSRNWIQNVINKITPSRPSVTPPVDQPVGFPSQNEINEMFNEKAQINFSDISFGEWKCPSCGGEHIHSDGVLSTWCRCSRCMQIYCAGEIHQTKFGDFTHCPWCGRRAKITSHIHPGEKVDMPVKGEINRSSPAVKTPHRLNSKSERWLPGKVDKP
jgi:curved DNA-binding protein CbpA